MKNYLRSLAHLKHNQELQQSDQTPQQMNDVLDQKLHYINRSFKHNLQIQEIFLDIIKTKRTLHSKQIKEYYKLFTENKADSEIFHNTIQQPHKEDLQQFLHIKEATRSLKRLYCRLIEKIMVKVSYYLMNKQNLNFMYKQVNDMMKKCQTLMRRINYLRDTHSVNELVHEIYRENEEMQIRIIQELIDKGFILSIDQFYRINGVDLVDKELYERDKSQEDEEEGRQYVKEKLDNLKKFQFNLNRSPSFQRMKKEQPVKKKEKKKTMHRVGYIQIENKYRDLLVHLENLINNDLIDQIAEEKEDGASSQENQDEEQNNYESRQGQDKDNGQASQDQKNQNQGLQSSMNNQNNLSLKPGEQGQETNSGQLQDKSQENSQTKSIKIKQRTKKSLASSKNVENLSGDFKSQLRQKNITLQSGESNSYISDILNNRGSRTNSHQQSSEFFSKSFMKAIKSMEKVNLNDKTNRLAIKRMSEQIMAFQRQQEHNSTNNAETQRTTNAVNLKKVLKRNNEKKSIIKLINIYKSRQFQQEIHSIQRQFDEYKDKIIKRQQNSMSPRPKVNKISIFCDQNKKQLNEISQEKTISNITNCPKITDAKQNKTSAFKTMSKYQRNPVFKNLAREFKFTQNINLPHELMKNLEIFKAKERLTATLRTPEFQNARLSHKLQHSLYRLSPPNSLEKLERFDMQANSMLTPKGISTVDQQKFKSFIYQRNDRTKLYKTAVSTPIAEGSPVGHFEIYDRKRRVILH